MLLNWVKLYCCIQPKARRTYTAYCFVARHCIKYTMIERIKPYMYFEGTKNEHSFCVRYFYGQILSHHAVEFLTVRTFCLFNNLSAWWCVFFLLTQTWSWLSYMTIYYTFSKLRSVCPLVHSFVCRITLKMSILKVVT